LLPAAEEEGGKVFVEWRPNNLVLMKNTAGSTVTLLALESATLVRVADTNH
jgi:hypothetical protein